MPIKSLFGGGGVVGFLGGGGGSANFIFMGVGIFPINSGAENSLVLFVLNIGFVSRLWLLKVDATWQQQAAGHQRLPENDSQSTPEF